LTPENNRGSKSPILLRLALLPVCCGILILAGCRPSPDAAATPPPLPKAQSELPATSSVVSIPEEFRSPSPTPEPTPVKPVLPRVVFATSDFQVTTYHGIQGISAGEAVNFLRQEGEDYVVRYGALEFKKNKSYFAATYVEPARPATTPAAGESGSEPVAAADTSAEPALPGEPPLGRGVPAEPNPALLAEQKKLGKLTDSIRALNDEIRAAQSDLDKKSLQVAGGPPPSAQEIKKASRAIQKLKARRDELSAQLTEMGKP
jgi:hypothetical protein